MYNKRLKILSICEDFVYKLLQNVVSCAIFILEYCLKNYYKLEELKSERNIQKAIRMPYGFDYGDDCNPVHSCYRFSRRGKKFKHCGN